MHKIWKIASFHHYQTLVDKDPSIGMGDVQEEIDSLKDQEDESRLEAIKVCFLLSIMF